jgi:type IV fimbrial biogenesis protein FimT
VHTGNRADCGCDASGRPQCAGSAVALKGVSSTTARQAQVSANVASLRFDPINGTVSPTGTICTTGPGDRAIHHVVNIMGRVRTCRPVAAGAPCAPC